ncbi:adenine deaminase [Acidovorax sp. MR-S7]|uniref:adenine deaminase n=1 Tax=Acidovorax sp. MR-S7 TaxID=1268622 RepID=UPI00039C7B04|nr:adenine deaminase [Acidovorax sp. MR-S7]GAD21691.1 adenine deaminase [Acidovorax sp. MR-S7]
MADLGIQGGRIVAIAESLGPGASEIDAAWRIVTPGGVNGHCSAAQLTPFDDSNGGVTAVIDQGFDALHVGGHSTWLGGRPLVPTINCVRT